MGSTFRLGLVMLAVAVLLVLPLPLSAQSCALCYTQAASSGAKMIAALKSGILILIAPPTLGTIGMIFVVYRKRNQFKSNEQDLEPHRGDWM